MRLLLPCLFLLYPLAAAAQSEGARSVEDCEKIKVDFAYNQCLASFGPKAREKPAHNTPAPASASEAAAEPAVGQAKAKSSTLVRRARGGRVSASFSVGRGKARVGRSAAKSRRAASTGRARGSRRRR